MKKLLMQAGCALLIALGSISAQGAPLLSPGDFIIAINSDPPTIRTSAYPANEPPARAIDDNVNSKHLSRRARRNADRQSDAFDEQHSQSAHVMRKTMGGTGPALLQKTRETDEISAERSVFVATATDAVSDPILTRLVAAWPTLSAGVRELIANLALTAEAAKPSVTSPADTSSPLTASSRS